MLPSSKRTGLAVVLTALVLSLSPAFADTPPAVIDSKKTDSEKLTEIAAQLRKIQADLDTLRPLEASIQIKNLTAQVEELRKLVGQLDDRMRSLETRVGQMSATQTRISGAFTPGTTPAAALGTGTIRLENRTGNQADIYINGVRHSLAPFQVEYINGHPAGSLTYEVAASGWGMIQGPTPRYLSPGETLRLTVFNP
jgi:TolA-binding protein